MGHSGGEAVFRLMGTPSGVDQTCPWGRGGGEHVLCTMVLPRKRNVEAGKSLANFFSPTYQPHTSLFFTGGTGWVGEE